MISLDLTRLAHTLELRQPELARILLELSDAVHALERERDKLRRSLDEIADDARESARLAEMVALEGLKRTGVH